MQRCLVLAVLLAFTPGCFDRDVFADCDGSEGLGELVAGRSEVSLCVDGMRRDLIVHVPDGVVDASLLIALHGGAGRAQNMEDKTALHDVHDGITVYPEGTPAGGVTRIRTWNAMHCCGNALDEDTDDVAFLAAIVETVRAAGHGDEVFVTGHSNGAMMAYRFAAQRPDVVDGVAAVAGTIGGQANARADEVRIPTPAEPVPVLIIHATDDEQVRYDGGTGERTIGGRVDLSVSDAVAFWRGVNDADNVTRTGGAYEEEVWEPTGPGAVVHVVTTTGGHKWPGDDGGPEAPDASAFIATWFAALPT